MKKILTLIGIMFISLTTFGQIVVSQSVTPAPPYQVGDTLTVKYTIARGTSLPRYFWLRYSFNNKDLAMVTNSTVFSQ